MAVTSISPSSSTENLSNITNRINTQDAAMNNIYAQVKYLSDVWNDDAQREFTSAFETTRRDVLNFNQALLSYVRLMQQSVDKFARIDEALSKALK
jgi:uncharacterized protein YukE